MIFAAIIDTLSPLISDISMPCCFRFSLSLTLIFSPLFFMPPFSPLAISPLSLLFRAATPPPPPFRYASPPRFSPFHAFAAAIDAVCCLFRYLIFLSLSFYATPLPAAIIAAAPAFRCR
jgi:hypothetical protein